MPPIQSLFGLEKTFDLVHMVDPTWPEDGLAPTGGAVQMMPEGGGAQMTPEGGGAQMVPEDGLAPTGLEEGLAPTGPEEMPPDTNPLESFIKSLSDQSVVLTVPEGGAVQMMPEGGGAQMMPEGGIAQMVPEDGLRANKRNYKAWTTREEAKLVELLVRMVKNAEFVSGKNFKNGHLPHLEQQLKVHFPKSGLTVKHIESKIRTLKKDCNAVYEMLNGPNASRFRFLRDTNMLDAPEEVWNDYLKRNPQSTKWKTKEFSHYYDLCMVFRKDRAQGNGEMNSFKIKDDTNIYVLDSGYGLDGNIDTQNITNQGSGAMNSVKIKDDTNIYVLDSGDGLDWNIDRRSKTNQGNGAMTSVNIKNEIIDVPDSSDDDGNIERRSKTNDHVEEPSSVRSGKRKSQADEESLSVRSRKEKSRVDPMVDGLSEACNIFGDHLKKAATKMSWEVELQEPSEKKVIRVIAELYKMELSRQEFYKAIDKITSNRRALTIFCSLEDQDREGLVKYKL